MNAFLIALVLALPPSYSHVSADTLDKRAAPIAAESGCYLNFKATNSASQNGVTIDLKRSRIRKYPTGTWSSIDTSKSSYANGEVRIAPGGKSQAFAVWAKVCSTRHRLRLYMVRRTATYSYEVTHSRDYDPRDLGDLMRFF